MHIFSNYIFPNHIFPNLEQIKTVAIDGKIMVIIGFKNMPGPSDIDFITGLGGNINRRYAIINAISAIVPETSIETIKRNPNVEYIEIDEKMYAHDCRVPIGICQEVQILKQMVPWGVERIGATFVHAIGNTGKGIKIGILDTGIDYTHPDLSKNYKGGYNFIDNNTDARDYNGHGTHVAGIIAAEDNDIGVVGVAPDAHIYSVRVLDYAASGSASDIVAGLEWSLNNHMQVVNMSLGACEDSISVRKSIDILYNNGILLIAAAGNNGNVAGDGDNIDNPARYNNVIAVGATDINDNRATFSSTGPKIELSAPGNEIYSTLPGNKYGVLSGTSMASPHAAGVAALIMSGYPEMTNTQVRVRMQITAQNITKGVGKDEKSEKNKKDGKTGVSTYQSKNWFGYGLVDAVMSVSI